MQDSSTSPAELWMVAEAHALREDWDGHLAFLGRLTEIDPYDSRAWYCKGCTFQQLQQYPLAILSFSYVVNHRSEEWVSRARERQVHAFQDYEQHEQTKLPGTIDARFLERVAENFPRVPTMKISKNTLVLLGSFIEQTWVIAVFRRCKTQNLCSEKFNRIACMALYSRVFALLAFRLEDAALRDLEELRPLLPSEPEVTGCLAAQIEIVRLQGIDLLEEASSDLAFDLKQCETFCRHFQFLDAWELLITMTIKSPGDTMMLKAQAFFYLHLAVFTELDGVYNLRKCFKTAQVPNFKPDLLLAVSGLSNTTGGEYFNVRVQLLQMLGAYDQALELLKGKGMLPCQLDILIEQKKWEECKALLVEADPRDPLLLIRRLQVAAVEQKKDAEYIQQRMELHLAHDELWLMRCWHQLLLHDS